MVQQRPGRRRAQAHERRSAAAGRVKTTGPPVRAEYLKPGTRLPGEQKERAFKPMLSYQPSNLKAGAEVRQIRREAPGMDTHKLPGELKTFLLRHRLKQGRDRLLLFLKKHGMLAKKKAGMLATTESNHPYYKYPNRYELMSGAVSDLTAPADQILPDAPTKAKTQASVVSLQKG